MISGGFLVTLANSGLSCLDLMLSRVANYHCHLVNPNLGGLFRGSFQGEG